jgi:hypothetical protein
VRARGLCGFAPSDQWRLLLAVHRRRSCWAVTRAALQGPRSSYSRVAESAHGSARGDVIAPRRPASSCCCCSRCRRCLLLLVRRAVHPAATPCPAVLRTLHHGGDCAGTPEPLSTYYSLPLARTLLRVLSRRLRSTTFSPDCNRSRRGAATPSCQPTTSLVGEHVDTGVITFIGYMLPCATRWRSHGVLSVFCSIVRSWLTVFAAPISVFSSASSAPVRA